MTMERIHYNKAIPIDILKKDKQFFYMLCTGTPGRTKHLYCLLSFENCPKILYLLECVSIEIYGSKVVRQ